MNIFDNIPENFKDEISTILLKRKNVRIEKIISNGQTSKDNFWYDQDEDEWVIVLQGKGEITYKDNSKEMLTTGDYTFIPAHKKHRVSFTSENPPCVWLCVFIGK